MNRSSRRANGGIGRSWRTFLTVLWVCSTRICSTPPSEAALEEKPPSPRSVSTRTSGSDATSPNSIPTNSLRRPNRTSRHRSRPRGRGRVKLVRDRVSRPVPARTRPPTLPVKNADDEIFAGMLVVQDVTERREYQHRLEESNERLEQFAYAVSHDLQEPLRMVTSYLQLLEQRYADDLDEDAEEFIDFAVDGAERMRDMIDGLLEYSRVTTTGDPLKPVELERVVDGCSRTSSSGSSKPMPTSRSSHCPASRRRESTATGVPESDRQRDRVQRRRTAADSYRCRPG